MILDQADIPANVMASYGTARVRDRFVAQSKLLEALDTPEHASVIDRRVVEGYPAVPGSTADYGPPDES